MTIISNNLQKATKLISLHIDTVVVEAACPTAIAKGSSKKRGAYSELAAAKKNKHYEEKLKRQGELFLPAPVETGGYIHPSFRLILRYIAEHVTNKAQLGNDVSPDDLNILRGSILNTFYQRLSIKLVQASMTCIDQAVLRLNRHLGFNIRNPGLEGSTAPRPTPSSGTPSGV